MDEALLSVLLEELKGTLRITWNDEDSDLIKIIKRAEAYLQDLCSTSFDFSEEDQPKTLLLERCRYVYNNAADEFEKNFHHELSRLIFKVGIKQVVIEDGTV